MTPPPEGCNNADKTAPTEPTLDFKTATYANDGTRVVTGNMYVERRLDTCVGLRGRTLRATFRPPNYDMLCLHQSPLLSPHPSLPRHAHAGF